MAQSFYEEVDINGNVGKPGQVKSYEVTMFTSQAEAEAEEMGMTLEEYLRTWWNECSMETPFVWETLGGGYGFHGDTIFEQEEPDGGTLRCKEIFDQIMFDVYPPTGEASVTESRNQKNRIIINESQLRDIIGESVEKLLNEKYFDPQIENPGIVKNDKVRQIGYHAQFQLPGKGYHNDSTHYLFKKHSGGKNAKSGLLGLYFSAKRGNADAAREFFRAIKHIPAIDCEITYLLIDNRYDAKSKKNADTDDYL